MTRISLRSPAARPLWLVAAMVCPALPTLAAFTPIPLSSTSFNESMIVPETAAAPVIPGGYTTASMDNGAGNTGTSWYEEGYDTSAPATGLPHPGTTFTSQSVANHSYLMAPSYTANDAVMLDSTLTSATLTLTAPAAFAQLSLLESGGNNGVSFSYTVHHQNGATDTGTGSIPDWYNGGNVSWTANGRVDVQAFTFSSVNGNDPRLYSLDLSLANTNSPVTSITFNYVSGGGHGAIMAISGLNGTTCTPLAVTGYNEDIVVEQGAGKTGSLGVTSATMDTGPTNSGTTFYELGYDPDAPTTGLPHAGASVASVSAPDHIFQMPSSYTARNAVLVCDTIPSVTITPASVPAAYKSLSFLLSCGNGPVTLGCSVTHQNGGIETNSIIAPDWYSYSPVAWVANGRVDVNNTILSDVNIGEDRLYSQDIPLVYSTSPVTSITLTFPTNGAGANAVIFAISGGTEALPLAGNDFNANTKAATAVLQQWNAQDGLYNSTGWWNAANCLEAVENDIFANNDVPYFASLANTFAQNESGDFLDSYYDDNGWWANAWIHAFDLTGNSNYLNMAKTIFAYNVGGWDSTNTVCPGGIWWNTSRTYKNAIPNELFLVTAIRLHQRTPNDSGSGSYFYWATNEWTWFKNSGMINSENLVNDGLNGCANNGETTWTYNQGVILAGLTDLYKVTGNTTYLTNAEVIANAAIKYLVNGNGILIEPCEPNCGGDGPQFKGIFAHYLAYLYDETRNPAYYTFLTNNAHSIWFNDRNVYNQLGLMWAGAWDSADAARQSSALMPISSVAEPITPNLAFIRGAGDPSFTHPTGSASGSLAWAASTANAAGYMVTGPHVTYLPAGPHALHFQAEVNRLNPATNVTLAQLSVVEENGGTTLASVAVPWSAFSEAAVPQDFIVLFTNNIPADPLDFEVYWDDPSGGPTFTVTDISVDGLENWSAANLTHIIGRSDGLNAWEADPIRDTLSGYLTLGPGVGTIPPGDYSAGFELSVDNFNLNQSNVATISVVNVSTGGTVASATLSRNQFPSTMYQTFYLNFNAVAGANYDFRTYWYYNTNAPRLTQRSVFLRPGPVPFFTSVSAPLGVTMNFTAPPGRNISVQRATDLTSGVWTSLGAVTVPSWLGTAQFTDPSPPGASFYRLVAP